MYAFPKMYARLARFRCGAPESERTPDSAFQRTVKRRLSFGGSNAINRATRKLSSTNPVYRRGEGAFRGVPSVTRAMTPGKIAELVREYADCASPSGDAGLRVLDAAIFVEECFGLVLSDGDLTAGNLGGPEAMAGFVARRMGL